MAGWISGPESDDEPLNLKMFARKSFAFQGFSEEMEDKLKKIVQQMGGVCDDFPKYILIEKKYYNSMVSSDPKICGTFYNVAYLRDCVDANRCLNIEQYKFGPKYLDKHDLKEFEACCQNFHNEQESCIVCDPFFMPEVEKPKRRTKSFITESQNENAVINTAPKTKLNVHSKKEKLNADNKKRRPIVSWEHWELRFMLDYAISNNLLYWVKSPSLFKKMHAEGFLTHRTVDAMRANFRESILKNLKAFDLPEPIYRKLIRINNATFPGRSASRSLKDKSKKLMFKRKLKLKQIKNVKS